jgi:hypothetical protein
MICPRCCALMSAGQIRVGGLSDTLNAQADQWFIGDRDSWLVMLSSDKRNGFRCESCQLVMILPAGKHSVHNHYG